MLAATAYGQTPTYTPMRSFYEYKGIKMDSLFLLPTFSDTTSANLARTKLIDKSVIMAGGVVYARNTSISKWVPVGGNQTLQVVTDAGNITTNDILLNQLYLYDPVDNDYGNIKFTDNAFYAQYNSDTLHPLFYCELGAMAIYKNDSTSFVIRTDSLDYNPGGNFLNAPNGTGVIVTSIDGIKANKNGNVNYGPGFNSAVDLSAAVFNCPKWGVYTITTGSGTNTFNLPDPRDFDGKYLTIINATGGDIYLGGYDIYDRGTSLTITTMAADKMISAFSDGNDWRAILQ